MAARPMNQRRQTPPAGPMTSLTPSWTDDIPTCKLSGIGYSTNQIYRPDGAREEEHEFEDRCFHFHCEDVYLYGVFDGHSGAHVADFVRQRLPVELLLGQLDGVSDDFKVKQILQLAFKTVEAAFFETIDPALAEKIKLKLQLPEGLSDYELYQKYPDVVEKLQSLDSDTIGGTSAILSLLHKGKLYVASVGDSRAVLCTREPDSTLKVRQLSIDHTIENEDELLRLSQLNLDVAGIQQAGGQYGRGLAGHPTTRSIGDYSFKGGYKDVEVLSYAATEPVIAEPEIIGGLPIDSLCGFLLMFTHGLKKSIEEATSTSQLNIDIAYRVAAEFQVQSTLSGVAQQVVDKVVRNHHDVYLSGTDRAHYCHKRDDMTLLVRNFDYPLGTPMSPNHPLSSFNDVTVPYSPLRTETSLSLIIPSNNAATPPTLAHSISQTPVITGIPSLTPGFSVSKVPITEPLFVNVDPQILPQSPSSSHTSTIESQPSSGTSTPQKYDTTQTNNTGTQGSSNSDTQSSPFLFQRQAEPGRQDGPDEEGFIESYVDFTEFMKAYKVEVHYSQ